MGRKPETVFRTRVNRDLKKLPHTAIFPIQQRSIIGDPDMILCICGKFIGLELKSAEGKPSSLQNHKLQSIGRAGGRWFVAYPDNWPSIYTTLMVLASKGIDHVSAKI
jgi:hypothetical protein